MMKGMGYREGTGLGTVGTGITAPIQPHLQTARTGLGFDKRGVPAVAPAVAAAASTAAAAAASTSSDSPDSHIPPSSVHDRKTAVESPSET